MDPPFPGEREELQSPGDAAQMTMLTTSGLPPDFYF